MTVSEAVRFLNAASEKDLELPDATDEELTLLYVNLIAALCFRLKISPNVLHKVFVDYKDVPFPGGVATLDSFWLEMAEKGRKQ